VRLKTGKLTETAFSKPLIDFDAIAQGGPLTEDEEEVKRKECGFTRTLWMVAVAYPAAYDCLRMIENNQNAATSPISPTHTIPPSASIIVYLTGDRK
jgi:hypothetical protein